MRRQGPSLTSILTPTSTVALIILVVLGGCAGPTQAPPEFDESAPVAPVAPQTIVSVESSHPDTLEQARDAAKGLGGALLERLSAELDGGSLVAAVDVCAVDAPAIATAVQTETMAVRRVTLRPRNPANTPDDWEAERLNQLEVAHARGEMPRELAEVVSGENGDELRYLTPIAIMEPCLLCHGGADDIDAEVAARIGEHYPDDQATGYALGDLRGAFSVRVKLGS